LSVFVIIVITLIGLVFILEVYAVVMTGWQMDKPRS